MALVSVIIPTHNDADYLPDSVGSLVQYTGPHQMEILVIDDVSEPPASATFQPEDPRVRLIRQSAQGVSAARNRRLDNAGGEYIFFLDADDTALPHRIEKQVSALRRHGEIGLVGGDVTYCDLEGNKDSWGIIEAFGADVPYDLLDDGILRFKEAFADLALHHFPFNTTVIALRRSLIDGPDPLRFDTDLSCWEDWDFVTRAARRVPVGYIREPLTLYRKRPGSITTTEDPRKFLGRAKMFEKWRKQFSGLDAGQIQLLKEQEAESLITASHVWRKTHRAKAARSALRAFLLQPSRRSLRALAGALVK